MTDRTTYTAEDRVTLLHNIPTHTAGEHGTVHHNYGHWIGVCFDNSPHLIRYIEPVDLAPAAAPNDAADLTEVVRAATTKIIEAGLALNVICSKTSCDTEAVWWAEHSVCGDTFYVCEPHRASTDERHAEHIERTGDNVARCTKCRQLVLIPVPWRAL